jgi:hypothetical protein
MTYGDRRECADCNVGVRRADLKKNNLQADPVCEPGYRWRDGTLVQDDRSEWRRTAGWESQQLRKVSRTCKMAFHARSILRSAPWKLPVNANLR